MLPIDTRFTSVAHDEEIPLEKRLGAGAYSLSLLCKQDKQQLDRIEKKLDFLIKAFNLGVEE